MTENGSPRRRTATRRTVLKGVAGAGASAGAVALGGFGTAAATRTQANGPDVTWNHTYRGDGEEYRLEGEGYVAYGRAAVGTNDGGFAIGTDGRTLSEDGPSEESYFALVKVDADGSQQWARYYDDRVEDSEGNVRGMAHTPDGGYVLVGEGRPATEDADPFDGAAAVAQIVKADAEGSTEWFRSVAPPGSGGWFSDDAKAFFTTVTPTGDGGYVAGGLRDGRGWLLGLDADGETRWENEYAARGVHVGADDEDVNQVRHVVETRDGGFAAVLAGGTFVVTDAEGRERWSAAVDATRLDDVVQTRDGGFVVAGDNDDFLLSRFTPTRKHDWTRTYPGPTGETDLAHAVVPTPDGGYAVSGTMTTETPGGPRLAVVKTDGAGNEQWRRVVEQTNGPGNGQSAVLTDDDGLVVSRNGPGLVKLGGTAPDPTTAEGTEGTTPEGTDTRETTRPQDGTPTGTTESDGSGSGDSGGAFSAGGDDEEDDAGPLESFFRGIIHWLEQFL